MNTNEITGGIIGITVVVLIFATAFVGLVYAIDEDNQTTFNNAPSGSATFKLDGNDDYELTTAVAYGDWTLNGKTISASNLGGTLVITDKCRFVKNGYYGQLFDESGLRTVNASFGTTKFVINYDASDKVFSVVTYNGFDESATVTGTYTYNVENILYYIPGGDYCAIETNGNPDMSYYVNDISQVIAGGAYTTGALDTSYFAEGLTVYVGNSNYTASATANSVNVDGVNGVIKGSSYAVSVTDGVNTEDFTPYTVFVPLTVKGTTDSQQTFNIIIDLLPLIVGVGILLGGVYYFISRQY